MSREKAIEHLAKATELMEDVHESGWPRATDAVRDRVKIQIAAAQAHAAIGALELKLPG